MDIDSLFSCSVTRSGRPLTRAAYGAALPVKDASRRYATARRSALDREPPRPLHERNTGQGTPCPRRDARDNRRPHQHPSPSPRRTMGHRPNAMIRSWLKIAIQEVSRRPGYAGPRARATAYGPARTPTNIGATTDCKTTMSDWAL